MPLWVYMIIWPSMSIYDQVCLCQIAYKRIENSWQKAVESDFVMHTINK
jgi:hypothetical protein